MKNEPITSDLIMVSLTGEIERAITKKLLPWRKNEPTHLVTRTALALKRCRQMADANCLDFSKIKERAIICLRNRYRKSLCRKQKKYLWQLVPANCAELCPRLQLTDFLSQNVNVSLN